MAFQTESQKDTGAGLYILLGYWMKITPDMLRTIVPYAAKNHYVAIPAFLYKVRIGFSMQKG